MSSRRAIIGAGALALIAAVAVGIAQAPRAASTRAPTAAQVRAALRDSPPVLAALHAQADQLLPGGARALYARLAALRGHPVVINKWGSWCGPCRAEFSVFARAAAALGRRVAFVGIDTADAPGDAAAFLRSHSVSYPSYLDRSGSLGTQITLSTLAPVTVFYDARGRRAFIHQGVFTSAPQLEQAARRYAIGS